MTNNKNGISVRNIFENTLFSWRYMWKNARKYAVLQVIEVFVDGLYPPAELLLTAWLFNSLEQGVDFKKAGLIVGCMVALLLVYDLWGYFYCFSVEPRLKKELHLKLQSELLISARDIELESYDNPDYYDDFLIAIQDADTHISSATGTVKSMVSAFFTLLATISLFVYVKPLVMILLLGSSIFSLYLNTKRKKLEYQANLEFTPLKKKEQYINRVFRLADYAKELRLKEYEKTLFKEYDSNTDEYVVLLKAFGRKKMLLQLVEILNAYFVYATVIVYSLYHVAVTATVLVGGLAIVINASWQFRGVMREFADMISELPKESLYISKIREFMDYQKKNHFDGLPVENVNEIEFEDVSFGYGNGNMILKNLNLKIRRGEHIAIVGCNGAGKSTLIKLLLNLYQPSKGRILYNGTDVSELMTEDYRKRFGVAFQDYQMFATSLAENVLADVYDDAERENVEEALRIATFDEKISTLKNGIFTPLTREFDEDGVCFSGGEEQKVAIARAIAKRSEIIIMDEPSAALDPIAEHKLNHNIKEYGKEKTVIYISHRLSTTRNLDRIYVLAEGRIVEEGSHEELMKLNGAYAELFNVQAQKYVSGVV